MKRERLVRTVNLHCDISLCFELCPQTHWFTSKCTLNKYFWWNLLKNWKSFLSFVEKLYSKTSFRETNRDGELLCANVPRLQCSWSRICQWPYFAVNTTVTSKRTSKWRHKSPASWLFTQPFIQEQIKENIKATRHWPLCWEFTGERWIHRTNGQ